MHLIASVSILSPEERFFNFKIELLLAKMSGRLKLKHKISTFGSYRESNKEFIGKKREGFNDFGIQTWGMRFWNLRTEARGFKCGNRLWLGLNNFWNGPINTLKACCLSAYKQTLHSVSQ